jgi:hypothetical protein
LTKGKQQIFKFLSRLPLSRLQTTRLCLYLRQGSLQVFIVAALNRFRVAEIEGIHPQGMIGEDYQEQRTMTMTRRQGVQYMHNHGVPVQDMMAAASHHRQIQQHMQYQFGVQQVHANFTYGIPPIVQAMIQFQANNNGNFAVGAVQNQEQQWIDVGHATEQQW